MVLESTIIQEFIIVEILDLWCNLLSDPIDSHTRCPQHESHFSELV